MTLLETALVAFGAAVLILMTLSEDNASTFFHSFMNGYILLPLLFIYLMYVSTNISYFAILHFFVEDC